MAAIAVDPAALGKAAERTNVEYATPLLRRSRAGRP